MNINIQPLSESIGQKLSNGGSVSIFKLEKDEIISLFKSYSVLLFRQFETNADTFSKFTSLFTTNFSNYAGGTAYRRVINQDQTLLSVNDSNDEVRLHGEMYYQRYVPAMLWFFCAKPSLKDGETLICDGKQFYDELSYSTKEIFSKKNLKFTRYQNKQMWQQRYKTDDLKVVIKICESNDVHLKINEDQSIVTEYISPAIFPSRCGKYKIFINTLLPVKQYIPNNIVFEDGTEITDDIVQDLIEISNRISIPIQVQKGDILMIDNTRVLHGRRAFADNQREMYVRIGDPNFTF